MFFGGFIIGVVLVVSVASTGWGADVLPAGVQRAERLCATNGGWARVNPVVGTVVCANNARFTQDAE